VLRKAKHCATHFSCRTFWIHRIHRRQSRIPRPLISPRSPGLVRQPCKPAEAPTRAFQLPWKLTPLDLEPPRFTRPTRDLLGPWDIRVRRYTSPTGPWNCPELLSPLPALPVRTRDHSTQTRSAKVHKGIQAQPIIIDRAVQSDSDWETPSASVAVQTETPTVDENNTRLGSLRVTQTRPPITYRERLT